MESYITAVFGTKAQAIAFHAVVLRPRNGISVKRAGVYGRGVDGDVTLQDTETDFEGFLDLPNLLSGTQEEVVDELNERLPDRSYAVVALVSESDPKVVDELAQQYSGRVYRRTSASLESAGYHRFIDSSSL